MKALVYGGAGAVARALKMVPKPQITKPTDAVVKITKTTICGTDLHISHGDVPACKPGTILGHEGIGIVDEIGSSVSKFKKGDKVIVSCITSCGSCYYCTKNLQSHCLDGGWILGHKIDGTQAEYVRIPHADNSLYIAPPSASDEALLMLSDILPTGYEVGVLSSLIKEGDSVAIVGAGPVGLAALITCQTFKPSRIIMIDMDDLRLEAAKSFGATDTVNPTKVSNVTEAVYAITNEATAKVTSEILEPGVDVAIECVGIPQTFQTCQDIIAPGGRIANVGVHGTKVDLQLQDLWIKNIQITTGLVSAYSTQDLLDRVSDGSIDSAKLVTHKFKLDDMEHAYDVFAEASKNKTIKTIIEA